jgi:hypothetical protein
MNYTEIEAKVREATNDDPWGPTGELQAPFLPHLSKIGSTFQLIK